MTTNRLLALLKTSEVIVADGAMGTMLHSRGITFEHCFDELNLTQPDLVAEIHSQYIHAGAQVIETNTFGANRYKLGAHGLEQKVSEINHAAAQSCRGKAVEAASGKSLIAGSVGPLGVRLAPFGRVQRYQAYDVYREQIAALAEAGCDLLDDRDPDGPG